MAKCGQFSHDLLDPRDRSTFGQIRLVRCTIVALNPRYNTVDVEFGTNPPENFNPPELVDIDCTDIPVFTGDGFSNDGQRRRFNDVPIYYHCQGSTGTIAELKMGHMAFRVPPVELTNPPWLQETVDEVHNEVLREKVLLIYIPPTDTDLQSDPDHPGYRYVIGHTDRNDVAPCVSEYVCLRIHDEFDDSETDNYGHSTAEKTVVTIVDCVAQRTYKGLEPYGITFPCLASDIINKVAAITINEFTPLEDIAFLDTLFTIEPLYANAFLYGLFEFYRSSYWNPDCHIYQPERLCWLTSYFDYGLQCTDTVDKADLVETFKSSYIWHAEAKSWTDLPPAFANPGLNTYPLQQTATVREFLSRSGGEYYVDINTTNLNDLVDDGVAATAETTYTGSDHETTFADWVVSDSAYWSGFYSYGITTPSASYTTISGWWQQLDIGNVRSYDYVIKTYLPWMTEPYYQKESTASLTLSRPRINNAIVLMGRQAEYGLACIAYDSNNTGVNFAYSPLAWYGDYNETHVGNLTTMAGATSYLSAVFSEMYTMWESTTPSQFGTCTAFIIDVVE